MVIISCPEWEPQELSAVNQGDPETCSRSPRDRLGGEAYRCEAAHWSSCRSRQSSDCGDPVPGSEPRQPAVQRCMRVSEGLPARAVDQGFLVSFLRLTTLTSQLSGGPQLSEMRDKRSLFVAVSDTMRTVACEAELWAGTARSGLSRAAERMPAPHQLLGLGQHRVPVLQLAASGVHVGP